MLSVWALEPMNGNSEAKRSALVYVYVMCVCVRACVRVCIGARQERSDAGVCMFLTRVYVYVICVC